MYGLIIDHISTCIRQKYGNYIVLNFYKLIAIQGDHVWTEIKYVAGIEQDIWKMDQVYSEGLVHRIIWAAQDVTGATIEDLMVTKYNSIRLLLI